MKKVFVLLLSGVLMFTLSNCEKAEAGPKGDKGATGNANVISSGWFTVVEADWEYNGDGNWRTTVSAPELTQEVIDKGIIQVYIDLEAWTSVYSLPTTSSYYSATFSLLGPGSLRIFVGGGGAENLKTYKYRYVIIPTSGMGKVPVGFDFTDYKKVSKEFNLN